MGSMDRASWYDLPEQGREDYFAWLHGTYLPALLKRRGYLWAAHYASVDDGPTVLRRTSGKKHNTTDPEVPRGDRFILLIGGADSNVFGDPVPSESHVALPQADRDMLAVRIAPRTNFTHSIRRQS